MLLVLCQLLQVLIEFYLLLLAISIFNDLHASGRFLSRWSSEKCVFAFYSGLGM